MGENTHRIKHLGTIAGIILSMMTGLLSVNHFALAQSTTHVNVDAINGVIDPITAQYVGSLEATRAVRQMESDRG
jgi:hypothetical protein